jgi:hypothetical protein
VSQERLRAQLVLAADGIWPLDVDALGPMKMTAAMSRRPAAAATMGSFLVPAARPRPLVAVAVAVAAVAVAVAVA